MSVVQEEDCKDNLISLNKSNEVNMAASMSYLNHSRRDGTVVPTPAGCCPQAVHSGIAEKGTVIPVRHVHAKILSGVCRSYTTTAGFFENEICRSLVSTMSMSNTCSNSDVQFELNQRGAK